MWRLIIAGFVIAHALVHTSYLSPVPQSRPGEPTWPFQLDHSWLLSRLGASGRAMKVAGGALVAAVVVTFVVAGGALLLGLGWRRAAAVIAAVASLVQLGLYFHPWLTAGLAIDIGIVVAVA